ncbi:hypothetical protein AGMMS49592_5680 [Endomicrobiia bacterium]|nr:hypothetical protein AGMMS49592_5680 [Endomicrobiia bacterium]
MLPTKNKVRRKQNNIWIHTRDVSRVRNSVGSNSVYGNMDYKGINTNGEAKFLTRHGFVFFADFNEQLKKYNVTTQKLLTFIIKLLNK